MADSSCCSRRITTLLWCLIIGLVFTFSRAVFAAENQVREGCWHKFNDAHGSDGSSMRGIKTVEECQRQCFNNASCVAIDFDVANPWHEFCWILFDARGISAAPQVDHYYLYRSCCWIGPIRSSVQRRPNGTLFDYGRHDLITCQAECVSWEFCIGIDVTDDQECHLVFTFETTSASDEIQDTSSHYISVSHYDIDRHCTVDYHSQAIVSQDSLVNDTSAAKVAAITLGLLLIASLFIIAILSACLLRKISNGRSTQEIASSRVFGDTLFEGSRIVIADYDELQLQYATPSNGSPKQAHSGHV